MIGISLYKHEQMLFALLKASLHSRETETAPFLDCSEEDWSLCHSLAVGQGVMALAWDGVMSLPAKLRPPLPLRLRWAVAVERYEKRYLYYCKTVVALSHFYDSHGISLMQLKGVGLSSLYPIPAHREGGDIDVYTYSANKDLMTDAEANLLADDLMRQNNIEVDTEHTVKHSLFYYNNLPVENHKTFLNVESYKAAVEAERILKEIMDPQPTSIAGGQVLTPSASFNKLFIAFHAAQHYGSGMSLHHLFDWACLLKCCGGHMPEGFSNRRFLRFVSSLTLLSGHLLGTDLPSAEITDGRQARKILEEILRPRFNSAVPAKSKLGILIYKTRRLVHNAKIKHEVFGKSVCGLIFCSIISHLSHPGTIFRR